jgi:adenine-specific DNA-methyltransferase
MISSSAGGPGEEVKKCSLRYSEVVAPEDPEKFIHLPVEDNQLRAREWMAALHTSLDQLGLTVSTGRVVDFRAKKFLRKDSSPDTVPLIYPCHFGTEAIQWPKENSRKPNAIILNEQTTGLLVPAETYVLVKRFTSKEEARRVVSCIFDPRKFETKMVGFENHLNYFHLNGHGLPLDLARGLAAFLNSAVLDNFFRQFNGHTQVNATDLRNLRYPTFKQLQHMGRLASGGHDSPEEIASIMERALDAAA